MVKELSDGVTKTQNIAKALKEIVTGENYMYDNDARALLIMLLQNHNFFWVFCL